MKAKRLLRFIATLCTAFSLHPCQAATELPIIGQWPGYARGSGERVSIAGSFAYFTAGTGLEVFDISNPSNPQHVGAYDTSIGVYEYGAFRSLAVAGNYAFVSAADWLQVIDITNPGNLRRVSLSSGWGFETRGLVISSNFAYLATQGTNGFDLWIADISNPAAPKAMGRYQSASQSGVGVAAAGQHAYLYSSDKGLEVIDVLDPSLPKLVGANNSVSPFSICVSGSYAYAADYSAGLQVLDVRNPSLPRTVGTYFPGSGENAVAVTVSGNYAYLGAGQSLIALDVSVPAQPTMVGSIDLPAAVWAISISSNIALVVTAGGLQVLSLADPTNPQVLSSNSTDFGEVTAITPDGTNVFLADRIGLLVLNVANPASPMEIGFLGLHGRATGIAKIGTYVYVTCVQLNRQGGGIYVVDVSDPTNPSLANVVESGVDCWKIVISDNNAYVSCGSGVTGIVVLDVSNPSNPFTVATFAPSFEAPLAVAGNLAYAGIGYSLQAFDVSDPKAPTRVFTLALQGEPNGIALKDHYAIVADNTTALRVIDVGDPTKPIQVGILTNLGYGSAITVSGNYAYFASAIGTQVIDLSDPTSPTLVAISSSPGGSADVSVLGSLVYTADGGGLRIFGVPGPVLGYQVGGGTLSLSWFVNVPNPILQSATALAYGGNWLDLTNTPAQINGRNVVTVRTSDPARFFRLRLP